MDWTGPSPSEIDGDAEGGQEGKSVSLDKAMRRVPTRNRKPLDANPIAPWELRIGDYRVYFEVKEGPARVVRIVAVGLKDRDRVLIDGVEVKLR